MRALSHSSQRAYLRHNHALFPLWHVTSAVNQLSENGICTALQVSSEVRHDLTNDVHADDNVLVACSKPYARGTTPLLPASGPTNTARLMPFCTFKQVPGESMVAEVADQVLEAEISPFCQCLK